MSASKIAASILIALGAGIMLLSVLGTRRVLRLLHSGKHKRSWRTLAFLMAFFLLGYVAALVFVLSELQEFLVISTGVIFFFSALFVFLVVRTGYRTIDDLTRARENLAETRDEALEASRLKSELLAKVSHELRTPVNAIIGLAEVLEQGVYGSITDKQRDALERIIGRTDDLGGLINELLDQAQLEAGILKLKSVSFDPADLIHRMKSTMNVLAEAKGVALTSEIAADVPATLSGDPNRLRQILVNLVENAVKFTEEGSVHVCIYRPDAAHWGMQVSDTGPGVAVEDQPHIFEAFRQADSSPTRRHPGTGLGLSIVKQLTEMMGGEITLESSKGQGSTFTVILPLDQIHEQVS